MHEHIVKVSKRVKMQKKKKKKKKKKKESSRRAPVVIHEKWCLKLQALYRSCSHIMYFCGLYSYIVCLMPNKVMLCYVMLCYVIFNLQQCYVELYINPASHAPGGQQ